MGRVENYDWKGTIKLNIQIMRIMGLWPKGYETYKLDLYMIFSRLIVGLFVVSHIITQVINIYFVRDSFESVIGIIYIILIEFMAWGKVYYVIKNMKILKDRIFLLKSEWFQPKDDNQKLLIEPSIKFWKSIYKVLLLMCLACNTFWMIYPLLDQSAGEKRLPFLAWYPYDVTSSPFYEISYVFQVTSTIYLTFVHINVDTMISGFNVYTGCQFDMLSDNLRNFVATNNPSIARENLIKCVIHHKRILNFIEGCNIFFRWIIFWHLIVSGLSIGITMFQLTLVVPLSNEFYSLLSYGIAIIVQIFMYCWFGNEVEVKSNLVSYAIFESNWINLPEDIKRMMLFFTMNVTKPVKVSAFGIFYLSVETFMKILKTAWSYFALLYQLGS